MLRHEVTSVSPREILEDEPVYPLATRCANGTAKVEADGIRSEVATRAERVGSEIEISLLPP